jgi:NADPH:quinone reductase-like Zn-dependent oxidoreductase
VLSKAFHIRRQIRVILTTYIQGTFPSSLKFPVVGGSDGAGEVIEVGSQVTKWKKGDRVATLFNPGHQADPMTSDALLRES